MRESIYLKPKLKAFWCLCAFQAGYLNSFGFLACHRFVSHMTGVGTQVGVSFGTGDYLIALEMLLAPLSFVIGAFFNSKFTYCKLDKRQRPNFSMVTLILLLTILLILIVSLTGKFGIFGEPLIFQRDFALMSCLCFFCGMQNSLFASMTNGKIRTTHLTGLSTDYGSDHARIRDRLIDSKRRRVLKKINSARIFTFIFFSVGAFSSYLISLQLEYKALIIPVLTSLFIFISIYLAERTKLSTHRRPKTFIQKLCLLINSL